MKLYNVVKTWDVYCVANTPEAARAAADTFIRQENLEVSDEVAIETKEKRNVRKAWEDAKPLVGADVSDDDFEKLKGKTTMDVFNMLHTKPEPKK